MPMHSEMKRLGMSPVQPPFGRPAFVCSQEVSTRLRTIRNDDLCFGTATINEERMLAVVRSNVYLFGSRARLSFLDTYVYG